MEIFIIVVISFLIVLLLCVLGGGLYAYFQAFYAKAGKENVEDYFKNNESFQNAKGEMDALINEVKSIPFEEVYIKSYDGLRLYGRYYHIRDGAPVQIQLHGYKGSAVRDFCGGHKLARKLGHNILLIDQRGCGKSEGNTITFGVRERFDALSWANYISERFKDSPIFLVGVSMGGATVLMTTDMELPKNVLGVIADCPYSSPEAIIRKVCSDRGMPEKIYPAVTLGAIIYGHFNPNGVGAVQSVKNARVPILILHGENDGFVPCSMAEEIYNSCNGGRYLYTFKGADHGMSYMTDPEKYERATIDFIDRCSEVNN
ncbi:MAG: alpha/beta hydrolase [Clostridia bacterium]|nr:alpha/beta hydrolase [Clostridia bacterium]